MLPDQIAEYWFWRRHAVYPILPKPSRQHVHPSEVPENSSHRWIELWQPGGQMAKLAYWSNSRTPREDPRVQDIYWRQGGMCPLCWHLLDPKTMHLDHDIPLSQGGANGLWNFQWTCAVCNLSKGSKTTEEFFESQRTGNISQMRLNVSFS